MKELYDLKDLLCEELKQYGKKGDLTAGSLDVVDKLSHALKSVETIIAMEEADDSYSEGYGGPYYDRSMRGSSYARGRRSTARRDSMGRYSRDDYSMDNDEMVEQLRGIMEEAPNEQVRSEIHRVVKKIEKM